MKIADIFVKPLEFITKYFKAFVFLLIVLLIFMPESKPLPKEPNVARIDLTGMILQSDSFLQELEKLENTPTLKGILFVIDSPGGAISPSVEISEAIKRMNAKIPVVAYAQGAMASGSYLAGVWADSIVANRGAILGSIGVIINGADVSALAEKLGIKAQSIKAGDYKEAGTFMRTWNQKEKEMLQGLVEEQYAMFVNEVAYARQIDPANEVNFGQGRILSANRALELGLIDKVGSLYDAQVLLFERANIQEPEWFEEERDALEVYLEKIFGEHMMLGIQNGIAKGVESFLQIWFKGN